MKAHSMIRFSMALASMVSAGCGAQGADDEPRISEASARDTVTVLDPTGSGTRSETTCDALDLCEQRWVSGHFSRAGGAKLALANVYTEGGRVCVDAYEQGAATANTFTRTPLGCPIVIPPLQAVLAPIPGNDPVRAEPVRSIKAVAADFDGDGLTDIAVVVPTDTQSGEPAESPFRSFAYAHSIVYVLYAQVTPSLKPGLSPRRLGDTTVYRSLDSLAAGDFDGDGRPDILLTEQSWTTPSPTSEKVTANVFLNSGLRGAFVKKDFGTLSDNGGDFSIAHVRAALLGSGDKRADLVADSWGDRWTFHSTGSAFTKSTDGALAGPDFLLGAFHKDAAGKSINDLVTFTHPSNGFQVAFEQNVNGSFLPVSVALGSLVLPNGSHSVSGDFNGDGFDDIAVIWPDSNKGTAVASTISINVLLNQKTRTFLDGGTWARQAAPWHTQAPQAGIGYANAVAGMAAANGFLFAAAQGSTTLWRRSADPASPYLDWTAIDAAPLEVVAMAATSGHLVFAVKGGGLYSRLGSAVAAPYTKIGQTSATVACLAAAEGKLYVATKDHRLLAGIPSPALGVHSAAGHEVVWTDIGETPDCAAMAAMGGNLFVMTTLGTSWTRAIASTLRQPWRQGRERRFWQNDVAGLTTDGTRLFGAGKDSSLWRLTFD